MKVTDKDIYIDGYLKENLDFCAKREKKAWDNLAIIDGDEGSGKSTLSWGIGYYMSWLKGNSFGLENIFFDVDKLMDYARKHKNKVIIWDEAAMEGLGSDWQNKLQRKLVKVLMVARNKGHFWIFNIPKFFKLNEYIAVDRSFFLINCYSPDNISRGFFRFSNKRKKSNIYYDWKFSKKRTYKKHVDFSGRFTKAYSDLINEKEYERMKDKAISEMFSEKGKSNPYKKQLTKLQEKVLQLPITLDIPFSKLAKGLGYSRRQLYTWKDQLNEQKKGEV